MTILRFNKKNMSIINEHQLTKLLVYKHIKDEPHPYEPHVCKTL